MSSSKTMQNWEVFIEAFDKLPETFKYDFNSIYSFDKPFPYTIYLPKDKNPFTKRNNTVVSIYNEELYIFEELANGIKKIIFSFTDIDCIEHGCVLLHSWLVINGRSHDKLTSHKIDFNTVTENLFINLINSIRFPGRICERLIDTAEVCKLDYMEKLNYKLYGYTLDGLVQGENIVYSIFQPEIVDKKSIFNKVKISPNYSSVLTMNELIVVCEEQSASKKRENYGVVFKIIPLKHFE